MPIPASEDLGYVLNDEQAAGRSAADRVAFLMHEKGEVALTGIDPDIAGILIRACSLEECLARQHPGIHIVVRMMGTFNFAYEQEAAEDLLQNHQRVTTVSALTSSSMRSAVPVIEHRREGQRVKVIGFDPDSLPFENASLDSAIVQDMRGDGGAGRRSASRQGRR